jgi:uncharacterized protein YciI
MEFDRYTIVLLLTPENPPELTEDERTRLQDAHLDHLARLHDQGVLLAAGPVGDPSGERYYRGLSILNVEPEEALRLKGEDPAIRLESSRWWRCRGCCRRAPSTSRRRRSRGRRTTSEPDQFVGPRHY